MDRFEYLGIEVPAFSSQNLSANRTTIILNCIRWAVEDGILQGVNGRFQLNKEEDGLSHLDHPAWLNPVEVGAAREAVEFARSATE